MPTYAEWPAPVRRLAGAVEAAVGAARAGDADAFTAALAELARAQPEVLAAVLGQVARELTERAYPDGMDADDAAHLVESCAAAAAWYRPLDPDALVAALAGALAVSLPEEASPGPAAVPHGLLLVAQLLEEQPGPGRLAPVLDTALRELRRSQTVELP